MLLLEWALAAEKALLTEAVNTDASRAATRYGYLILDNGVTVGTIYKWGGEVGGYVRALEVGNFSAEGLRRIAWAIDYNLRDVFLSTAQKAAAQERDRALVERIYRQWEDLSRRGN